MEAGAERVVQKGDFVMMDFGAEVNGYSAEYDKDGGCGECHQGTATSISNRFECSKYGIGSHCPE